MNLKLYDVIQKKIKNLKIIKYVFLIKTYCFIITLNCVKKYFQKR